MCKKHGLSEGRIGIVVRRYREAHNLPPCIGGSIRARDEHGVFLANARYGKEGSNE